MKWENNRWGRKKWWSSSNIFINIMTWIESLFRMKGRSWGQTGGNVTKSVMIYKLSLNELVFFRIGLALIMLTRRYCMNSYLLLHNHNLRGAPGDDVITYISVVFELRRFHPIILMGGISISGHFRRVDNTKTQLF